MSASGGVRAAILFILLALVVGFGLIYTYGPDEWRLRAGKSPSPAETGPDDAEGTATPDRDVAPGLPDDPQTPAGIVVTPDGSPVPYANIYLLWSTEEGRMEEGQGSLLLRSDASGHFPLPPSGYPLMLEATRPGYAPRKVLVAAPNAIRVVLEKGVRHHGIVVDGETEAPVNGAKVIQTARRWDGRMITREVRTGPDGRFRTDPLPDWEILAIQTEHPSYAPDLKIIRYSCTSGCEHRIRLASPAHLSVLVTLPDGSSPPTDGTVSVVVGSGTDMSGRPLPEDLSGRTVLMAPLNRRGEARFRGIPPGRVEIWASAPGYAAVSRGALLATENNQVAMRLLEGRALTGYVWDATTGGGIEGARLTLVGYDLSGSDEDLPPHYRSVADSARGILSARSGWNGAFGLVTPARAPSTHSILVEAPGYAPSRLSIPRGSARTLEIDLRPLPAEQTFAGRVFDSEDQPVEGAVLFTDRGSVASADRFGRFHIRLLPGADLLEVWAEGHLHRSIRVEDPQMLQRLVLHPAAVVEGHLDPPPDLDEHVRIVATGPAPPADRGQEKTTARVGADGRFQLVLAQDQTRLLKVESDQKDWQTGRKVPTGEENLVVRWRTGPRPPTGDIFLLVTSASTNRPVAIYDAHALSEWGVRTEATDRDLAGGSFLRGIPPGKIKVYVTAEGYFDKMIPMEVAPLGTVKQRVQLQPTVDLARGRIVDTRSEAVSGADLQSSAGVASSDGSGAFSISVKVEDDLVRIRSDRFLERRIKVTGPESLESFRLVQLSPAMIVSGRVDPPPDPGEEVTVSAHPRIENPDELEEASVVVAPEGTFRLVLAAGTPRTLLVLSDGETWETGQAVEADRDDLVLPWRRAETAVRGSVLLRVTDQTTGEGIAGFKAVALCPDGSRVQPTDLDSEGGGLLADVEPGVAWVRIIAEGYFERELPVQIVQDQAVPLAVALEPIESVKKGNLELLLKDVVPQDDWWAFARRISPEGLDGYTAVGQYDRSGKIYVWRGIPEGWYSISVKTPDGRLSAGVKEVKRISLAILDQARRGKLIVRLGVSRPSWVMIHRIRKDGSGKDFVGVFRCAHVEREDGQGQVQEVQVLLKAGSYEVTFGSGADTGYDGRPAQITRGQDTIIEVR